MLKYSFFTSLSLSALFIFSSAHALVDYSESGSGSSSSAPGISVRMKDSPPPREPNEDLKKSIMEKLSGQNIQSISSASASNYTAPSGMFLKSIDFGLLYESIDIKNTEENKGDAKVDLVKVRGILLTPYSLFLDMQYFAGKSEAAWLAPRGSKMQAGNPQFTLGVNWLKLGDISDRAQIDLFAGASLKAKNSDFGSSRTDKSFGMRTTKNFFHFVIGLVGEYRMAGVPQELSETAIGNITQFGGAIAWVVSTDITLQAEAYQFQIDRAKKTKGDQQKKLDEKVKFMTISPKILLGLGGGIELTLGGNIVNRKIPQQQMNVLSQAKLFDIDGVYGNSVCAGLNFSL